MALGNDSQGAVGHGLPVDGETRGHGALEKVEILDIAFAEAGILVKAIEGIFRAGRLPMHLVADLLDVRSEKGLEEGVKLVAAAHTFHEGTDPGGPMRL